MTNHTVAGDQHKPALGPAWSYAAAVRLLLEPGPPPHPHAIATLLRSAHAQVGGRGGRGQGAELSLTPRGRQTGNWTTVAVGAAGLCDTAVPAGLPGDGAAPLL